MIVMIVMILMMIVTILMIVMILMILMIMMIVMIVMIVMNRRRLHSAHTRVILCCIRVAKERSSHPRGILTSLISA
jgi:hypothetical protein